MGTDTREREVSERTILLNRIDALSKRWITWKDAEFRSQLEPGDVLILDTMNSVISHFAKLAENRPVNHVVLYIGDDQVIQCARPTLDHPALRVQPISEVVGNHIRTATVLRHRSEKRAEVVKAAKAYLERQIGFDYGTLLRVFGPCLMRSYHGWETRGYATTLGLLSRILLRPHKNGRLTCCSFVVSAFTDAGLTIESENPLSAKNWTVTPKDLWSSDSFYIPVVLHRPPTISLEN